LSSRGQSDAWSRRYRRAEIDDSNVASTTGARDAARGAGELIAPRAIGHAAAGALVSEREARTETAAIPTGDQGRGSYWTSRRVTDTCGGASRCRGAERTSHGRLTHVAIGDANARVLKGAIRDGDALRASRTLRAMLGILAGIDTIEAISRSIYTFSAIIPRRIAASSAIRNEIYR